MSAAWLGLSAATQRCRTGTGAESLLFPSSHIHPLTATLEGVGHSPTWVNKKSTDFRANGVEPSWWEVKAVRTTALQAGVTISPISGMRTLRHMGLGELLKHTLAAEPGSWIPGLPLSPSLDSPQSLHRAAHLAHTQMWWGLVAGEHGEAPQDHVGWS